MRESATKRYKVFQIPIEWMLDTGFVTQVINNSLYYSRCLMYRNVFTICKLSPMTSIRAVFSGSTSFDAYTFFTVY